MAGLGSYNLNTANSEINNIWGYNPNTIPLNKGWSPSTFTSRYGGLANLGGQIVGSVFDNNADYQRTTGERSDVAAVTDTVGTLAENVFRTNPIWSGIGKAAMGVSNSITGGTSGMTTTDAMLGSGAVQGALTGIAATLGASAGPVGWGLAGAYFLGSTLNSALGKTTMKDAFANFLDKNKLSTLDSAYYRDPRIDNLYNKKYGGFSLGSYGKAQEKLRRDLWEKATKLDIFELANLGNIRAGMVDANLLNYKMNINGGYTPTYIGKNGLNTEELFKARKLLQNRQSKSNVLEKFLNGGTVNVIPEGALHARKHNMENSEHITKKGIPVVDNEGKLQAEIERNEIIFRKEVTDELERLRKDGSDEAAIEAGRLLTTEIIENTEDRTGLIEEVTGGIQKHQTGGVIDWDKYTTLGTNEITDLLLIDKNTLKINNKATVNNVISNVYTAATDIYNTFKNKKLLDNLIELLLTNEYLLNKKKALEKEKPFGIENPFKPEKYKPGAPADLSKPLMQEGGELVNDTQTLESYLSKKVLERIELAINKATTRKYPYMFKNPSWKNCIATATDNFGITPVYRNVDFVKNFKNYGFKEIFFDDNVDTLPEGTILIDYNHPNDPNTPGHAIMLVGRTEKGAPIYSYSSGDSNKKSMHNLANYSFYRWDDKVKPRAFLFVGTPLLIDLWTKEYNELYPEKMEDGGELNTLVEKLLKLTPELLVNLNSIIDSYD